MKATILYT